MKRNICAAAAGFLLAAAPLSAQGLADYDYDQLTLRGIGFDAGYIFPDKVDDTPQFGMRFDLGYLGPGFRILPRVAYFSSSMTGAEVDDLEARMIELVFDQNPLAPVPVVDLGTIDWSAVTVGLDGQFVWRVPLGILTYLGAGFAAHFQNGEGAAIEGTFVEDLLDSVVAGANAHAGIEIPVTRMSRIYGDIRYEFLGDLRFPAVRVGVQLMITDPAPGEGGGG